jgi:hypothetical protein
MNWIKENKFVAGFGAVMIVALGVLAFLFISANGKYTEVSDTYTSQSAELNRLQNLKPYPDDENLQRAAKQKDEYVGKITALQDQVAAMQFSLQPMSPGSFQSSLKDAVNEVTTKASANGVTLPAGFYLGFQDYQSAPPRNEAAAALGQQLQAIKLVVDALLAARVAEISAISRDPLPEEAKAPPATEATGRPMPPGGPNAAANNESKLLKKEGFQIGFVSEQSKFHRALNAISTATEQFLVVKNIRLHNEQLKGPSRTQPNSNSAGGSTPPPQATNTGDQMNLSGTAQPGTAGSVEPDWLKPIVGREKVNVTLDVDIIDFAKPAVKTASK